MDSYSLKSYILVMEPYQIVTEKIKLSQGISSKSFLFHMVVGPNMSPDPSSNVGDFMEITTCRKGLQHGSGLRWAVGLTLNP